MPLQIRVCLEPACEYCKVLHPEQAECSYDLSLRKDHQPLVVKPGSSCYHTLIIDDSLRNRAGNRGPEVGSEEDVALGANHGA